MAFELRNNSSNLILLQGSEDLSYSEIVNIKVEKLKHFKNHPFTLYEGQRFEEMVQSIRVNGIYIPITVRPMGDDYEVLAGHNRLEAARAALLEKVPCIVKEDLTDEEAEIIVIETNLNQRSFSEFKLSEKVNIVSTYYNSLKKQGKRKDLINDMQNMLNNGHITSPHFGEKLSSEETSEKYELNRKMIERYLRLNKLSSNLKKLLDTSQLRISAGVPISFLSEEEQEATYEYLCGYGVTPTVEQAEKMKKISKANEWSEQTLKLVFWEEKKEIKNFNIKYSKIQSYFKNSQTKEEIEEQIVNALEFYENNKGTD